MDTTKAFSTKPFSSDVAFTPSVKAVQARKGLRPVHRHIEERGGWRTDITPDLAAFIAAQTSIFLATANRDGQPYIQHRGGPPGFLHVLDARTIAFADYAGNRQYITLGNLAGNDRAFLFLLDFAARRRIKLWGRARVVEDDPALLARLADPGYRARPERAILFTVEAWDVNCSQHITARFTEDEVAQATAPLLQRIATLEAENAQLRAAGSTPASNSVSALNTPQ